MRSEEIVANKSEIHYRPILCDAVKTAILYDRTLDKQLSTVGIEMPLIALKK
jgi:hypothetical protein